MKVAIWTLIPIVALSLSGCGRETQVAAPSNSGSTTASASAAATDCAAFLALDSQAQGARASELIPLGNDATAAYRSRDALPKYCRDHPTDPLQTAVEKVKGQSVYAAPSVTPSRVATEGAFSGAIDLVSEQGYQAQETFSVTTSRPVIDISDAPPGFADIKFKTTAIQEQLTNRSSGRSIDLSKTDVPGSQVVFLFPAKSPVCKGESSFNSPLYLFSNPNAPAVPSESDVGSGGCEVPIAQLSSAISPKTAIPAGGSASLAVPDPNAANISLRYKEAEAPAALAEIAAPKLVAHSVFVNSGWRHAQPGVTLSQMGRKIDFVGLSTSAPLSLNLFGQ